MNKRAHKLFGKEDSEHKQKWIEEEFKKRQQKRKEKERRKGFVDTSLGVHPAIDLNLLAQNLIPQNILATLTDIQMLCNNLPDRSQPDMEDDKQQFPSQILELLQQLSQPQNATNEATNEQESLPELVDNVGDKPDEKLAAAILASTLHAAVASQEKNDTNQTSEFPIDAVMTLMQLNAGWRQ